MDQIKEEIKMEADAVAKQQSASLWEGEIRVQMGGKSEDILAPVQILHKDDSRNGCRLFDWTPGFSTVEATKYPMDVLGGKSKPKLKNLKPFIKDSHIVELVCKDSKHESAMEKMLESGNKEKNFFFLDPGSSTPLVVVTVNKELFGSCVSLRSNKEVLASYEDFRHELSNNLVQHSWSEDFGKDSGSTRNNIQECTNSDLQSGEMDQIARLPSENTSSSEIKILHSWTEALDDDGQNKKASTKMQTQCGHSCSNLPILER